MLEVELRDNTIHIGEHFSVSFQRTLRIPDDNKTYPLPPSLGEFPICKVEDYKDRVPATWKEHGGVFIPMYQREALWMNFDGAAWRPNAVKIAIGKINAITGESWNQILNGNKQDYIVCPDQPWLDGINAGEDYIKQFIAMPLGMGYTVEGQVSGKEEFGGMQIIAFDPKPGRFPDKPSTIETLELRNCVYCLSSGAEMGLGAGGKMKQEIYPDEYGVDTWDQDNYGRVFVHIVNSMMYREITGMEPPPTPVTAKTYTKYGLPWFDLYNEGKGNISPSDIFYKIKSVKNIDKEKGFSPQQDDSSVEVTEAQVKKLVAPNRIKDGKW